MKTWRKQPRDFLDYDILGGDWLATDDEIVDVQMRLPDEMDDLTVNLGAVTPHIAKLWIGGGVSGKAYRVEVLLETLRGRVKEVDLMFVVAEI